MPDEYEIEIYRALRTAQEKYTYFLLAAAGAAIGFAINQTRDSVISWSQVPLAAAVLSFGLSFFFGCRHALYGNSVLYSNASLFRVKAGRHPLAGDHPQKIEIASAVLRDKMEEDSARGGRMARWQFGFLITGAVLYVAWHILSMYLRN
jgi:hypothetical protein